MISTGGYRDWKNSKSLRTVCLVSQCYAAFMLLFVPLYCIYLITTRPKTDPVCYLFSICLSAVIVINMTANWVIFTKSLRASADVINKASYFGKHLSHCPICELYVLRRDHHCFFLGGCVGVVNLVNFVAFCFHAFIGTAYASVVIANLLNSEYKELFSSDFIYFFVPFAIAKWLVGHISFVNVVNVTLLSTVMMSSIGALAMLILQVYLIYSWRTSRELWRSDRTIRSYRSLNNFKKVFGKRWMLALLFPTLNRNYSDMLHDLNPREPLKYV
ncbi:zinc finger, DHHC-type containing 22 [Chamberlinius hualienensis]